MKIHASGEDYLEAVLVLQKNHGAVRSIDVARRVGVSKASVSYAVSALREGGFLTVDSDYVLHLTETGRNVAEKFMSGISSLQSNLSQLALTLKLQSEMLAGLNTPSVRTPLKRSGMHTNRKNRILMPVVPTVRTRAASGENISPLAALHERQSSALLFSPVHHFSLSALMHRSMYRCDSSSPFPAK